MKNAMIFGDSISTFKNHIPEGYACYYYEDIGPTDVRRVEDTWWYQVIEEGGMNLVLNESWSSSTISYTALSGTDASRTSSFIRRLKKLIEEGFFAENKIDTVFVFGGTNDSWSAAKRGEIKHEGITNEDLYCTFPAICYFFRLLRETLPEADIYCLVNPAIDPDTKNCFSVASAKNGITEITFGELDVTCNHPTIVGMKQIKNRVLEVMGEK